MAPRFLVLFVLLAQVCSGFAADAANADPPVAPATPSRLGFKLVRDYLIIAQLAVGRFRNLNFIVDTGSNRTIIDKRLADRLELRPTKAQLTAINAIAAVAESTVAEIQVGSRRFTSVPVLVSDLTPLRQPLGAQLDGIIGTDLLGHDQLGIDYRTRTLTLGECSAGNFRVPFETTTQLAGVRANIDGRPVRLLVDTGASATLLFRAGHLAPAKASTDRGFGFAGQMAVSRSLLRDASLGEDSLANRPAFVVDHRPDDLADFEGFLSPAALGFKRICLDFARREFSWLR